MTANQKIIRGTKEWAVAEINCCQGCSHGCNYCYARYDQVERRKLVSSAEWEVCRVIPEDVSKKHPLYPGQVMFPTAHDIVPENLEACITVIHNLLEAGNQVLIVSKPHKECVARICSEFADHKDNILFRFTITARNDSTLHFWEPQAPRYVERKDCLEVAYNNGFATSVSVEPMLDSADVVAMVHELLPWVSHSIWLGKMNKIEDRVACDSEAMRVEIGRVQQGQSDEQIKKLYRELGSECLVRWKESIKEVVGIQPVGEPGLDI